ncbi:unnamed protein product, partial [Iphiclides podalirius]
MVAAARVLGRGGAFACAPMAAAATPRSRAHGRRPPQGPPEPPTHEPLNRWYALHQHHTRPRARGLTEDRSIKSALFQRSPRLNLYHRNVDAEIDPSVRSPVRRR